MPPFLLPPIVLFVFNSKMFKFISIIRYVFDRILRLVPKYLTKWHDIIDENVAQIKNEYIFTSKKAVIDFVLGKSLEKAYNIADNLTQERCEVKEIGNRLGYKYTKNYYLNGVYLIVDFIYFKCSNNAFPFVLDHSIFLDACEMCRKHERIHIQNS